jgi:hypothetical protein
LLAPELVTLSARLPSTVKVQPVGVLLSRRMVASARRAFFAASRRHARTSRGVAAPDSARPVTVLFAGSVV